MSSLIPPLLIVYLLSAGITAAVALWALQRHRERGAVALWVPVGIGLVPRPQAAPDLQRLFA